MPYALFLILKSPHIVNLQVLYPTLVGIGFGTYHMCCGEATFVASRFLKRFKVEDRVAAHQTLQLSGAEEVQGWSRTQHGKASRKSLHTAMIWVD